MFKQETNVQTFNSAKFGALRTQTVENGQILFCLNDVAKALELSNPRNLVQRLNERGVHSVDTPTHNQHGAMVMQAMNFIDEPNLYRCIFQSRKKEAEQFQTWVFEEVLPSIRQNGGYLATTQSDTPELIMARALQVAQATIENHKQQLQITTAERDHYQEEVKALAPKAQYTTFTQILKKLKNSHRSLPDKKRRCIFVVLQQGQHLYKVANIAARHIYNLPGKVLRSSNIMHSKSESPCCNSTHFRVLMF